MENKVNTTKDEDHFGDLGGSLFIYRLYQQLRPQSVEQEGG